MSAWSWGPIVTTMILLLGLGVWVWRVLGDEPDQPPKPKGSHFVNTCPDGRGGGVWVDVNAPPIPVATSMDLAMPPPPPPIPDGAAALGVEIERASDALTDDLLASPFSPFRPRPGTYR